MDNDLDGLRELYKDDMKYKFWKDGDLQIRTCLKCKASEFKSEVDGAWCSYVTLERVKYVADYFNDHGDFPPECIKW